MRVLLVSTYELGHQPLHLAAPAAALRERGHEVRCLDLSVEPWDPALASWADKVGFSVPMHTATRLALRLAPAVPAPVCFYGLYAAAGAGVADRLIAGEYTGALVRWVEGGEPEALDLEPTVELGRDSAPPLPWRDLLPPLERYAHLALGGEERVVGSVEASHGCAHRCRHCPVPVVYDGRIRIVPEDIVLADVARQVGMGARHITFADPDFLNGVHHSRRVVRGMHARFPDLTFDCTVKVEHILRYESIWGEMAAAGCLFVVSAFETVDDAILERLDKGHTAADAARAVTLLREQGIEIRPSFLPFTPWTTLDGFRDLLDFVADHELVGNVDPVQYTIRLLLPPGSLLLDHPDLAPHLGPYDAERLSYRWSNPDPDVDQLQLRLAALVEQSLAAPDAIDVTYRKVRAAAGSDPQLLVGSIEGRPRLTEPWFC
jgi:radical SAM superfamily enzyme YgiQ (UPF0313 family)